MAIIKKTITVGQKPTKRQLAEINECAKKTIMFDDDCPELTTEQLAEFAIKARELRRRPQVTIRIEPAVLEKYKLLGKGYTGIMSDVLAYAISNPDLIKKAL